MKLTLTGNVEKMIEDRIASGSYKTAEDVIAAAISNLEQGEDFGDFEAGELERLLEEGERDIANGDVIDVDIAFAELRRMSESRRSNGAV